MNLESINDAMLFRRSLCEAATAALTSSEMASLICPVSIMRVDSSTGGKVVKFQNLNHVITNQ